MTQGQTDLQSDGLAEIDRQSDRLAEIDRQSDRLTDPTDIDRQMER